MYTDKLTEVSDYFNLHKKMQNEIKSGKPYDRKNIKVGILSSFTIKGIKEILSVKCWGLDIFSTIYVGEYNQYLQEIMNKDSEFYKADPDLMIIFIDIKSIMKDLYFSPYQISDEQRVEWVDKEFERMQLLVQKIKDNSSGKILIHNFEVPLHSPIGIVENKRKFGFIESVEKLNAKLRDVFKNDSQVFIFDFNSFCSRIGKQNVIDYKMYYLGDMKLDLRYMPELCNEYLSYIKPLLSLSKKCLVLDLDNVLWGGVIGEDGLEGIKLDPAGEGKPFLEFQKYILSLFNRGVILAVNSKNNISDVLDVFKRHPFMILKEDHFAAMQINWNDKISNMRAIAEELNIGLDSLVYIDDDQLNREMMKKALPEIDTVDLPEDSSLYLKTIMEVNDFNTFQITKEDENKGQMYVTQKKRRDIQERTSDITEYLRELELVVTIEKGNPFTIPRISQLTQKTNQFNMTTRRYLEEEVKQMATDNKFLTLSVKVDDKFGDNGITGAVIIEKKGDEWRIDSFLLSCRVIGLKVEESILANILGMANKERAKILTGEFIPTDKNMPAKDFYKNNGFKLIEKIDGKTEIWQRDTTDNYTYPDFIKVIRK